MREETGLPISATSKMGKILAWKKISRVVPMERIVTALPEDTMRIISDANYIVEPRFTPLSEHETKVEFTYYYSTKSLKAKLFNDIAKRKIARDAQEYS